MSRYYVFNTQAEAQACVDRINIRARAVFRLQGYEIDRATGGIIPKRLSDGQSMPDAAQAETWDVPRQRLDGKWIVAHCEAVPGATLVIRPTAVPPLTVAGYVAQDIPATVMVEAENISWWPVPPKVVVGV